MTFRDKCMANVSYQILNLPVRYPSWWPVSSSKMLVPAWRCTKVLSGSRKNTPSSPFRNPKRHFRHLSSSATSWWNFRGSTTSGMTPRHSTAACKSLLLLGLRRFCRGSKIIIVTGKQLYKSVFQIVLLFPLQRGLCSPYTLCGKPVIHCFPLSVTGTTLLWEKPPNQSLSRCGVCERHPHQQVSLHYTRDTPLPPTSWRNSGSFSPLRAAAAACPGEKQLQTPWPPDILTPVVGYVWIMGFSRICPCLLILPPPLKGGLFTSLFHPLFSSCKKKRHQWIKCE